VTHFCSHTNKAMGHMLRYRVCVTKASRHSDRSVDRRCSPATIAARADRASLRTLSIQYAARLACAHLLGVADAAAIVIPLRGQIAAEVHPYFAAKNAITAVVIVLLGSIAVAVGGVVNLAPALRWFVAGQQPDSGQRQAAMRVVSRQSMILAATWVASGAIFILLNLGGGVVFAVATLLAVVFGGTAAASISLLLTQRPVRPILAAAAQGAGGGLTAPGVLARLVGMWLLGSALPCAAIAVLILIRSNGWIIQKTASVEMPILVITLAAVLVGLPAMILTSRSISDPIREVVDAMAEVEHGRINTYVGVYERSEIGRLQSGFNRMVAALGERDRLRDLFGRHVGIDVARRAIEEGASLTGDVREAAILFIDLVGSTKLAATRPPQEVAQILNDFFRIVVSAVDQHQGLINKFQGDAVLAVFGAPLSAPGAASAALATARALHNQLHRLPMVDFGIGVSAGPVFAGNIGSENRYEYTVIGDAVNEAARLADLAKTLDRRVVCSAAAIDRADTDERQHWASHGGTVLRGRAESTHVWIAAGTST
jgi:adenylate cyclase